MLVFKTEYKLDKLHYELTRGMDLEFILFLSLPYIIITSFFLQEVQTIDPYIAEHDVIGVEGPNFVDRVRTTFFSHNSSFLVSLHV